MIVNNCLTMLEFIRFFANPTSNELNSLHMFLECRRDFSLQFCLWMLLYYREYFSAKYVIFFLNIFLGSEATDKGSTNCYFYFPKAALFSFSALFYL